MVKYVEMTCIKCQVLLLAFLIITVNERKRSIFREDSNGQSLWDSQVSVIINISMLKSLINSIIIGILLRIDRELTSAARI